MRVKVDHIVSESDFEGICMANTLMRLKLHKYDTLYYRRRFFSGKEYGINYETEIVFARLYDKIGLDTNPVRKFRKFREKYLQGIKEIWNEHYHCLRGSTLPANVWDQVQSKIREMQYNARDIEYAFDVFDILKKRPEKKIAPKIMPLYRAAIEDNFSMFHCIYKGNGAGYMELQFKHNTEYIKLLHKSLYK